MKKSYLGRMIFDHTNQARWGVVFGGGDKCLLVRNPETGKRYRIHREDMRRGRPRTAIPSLRVFRPVVFEAKPQPKLKKQKPIENTLIRGVVRIPMKGIRE